VKVVLFCGGLGTRLREHSETIPKPLVEVGGRPILWHLMSYYASFGHKDFILCLGYRGDMIRQYFLDYNPYIATDFTMENGGNTLSPGDSDISDWRITFLDTGLHSNLGQRLMAVRPHLEGEEYFLANYSDQLSDLPLDHLIGQAKSKGCVAAFVSVKPQQSFHNVETDDNGNVMKLRPAMETDYWINGGYFVLRKDIFDFMEPGEEMVEEPFTRLIEKNLLWTHRYSGFWRAIDTFKDKITFDRMHGAGDRPWALRSQQNGPKK
jgi:glucose-1-phosphate cytidylyltransferase